MKKEFTLMMVFVLCAAGRAWAEEISDAEAKATEIHRIATSDAIYSQEEVKALYYQNLQIIELLKQIRQLLGQQLELAKKEKPAPPAPAVVRGAAPEFAAAPAEEPATPSSDALSSEF